ncbi:MAG: ATP-binding protein [Thermodesulfovibrionales bacterium]
MAIFLTRHQNPNVSKIIMSFEKQFRKKPKVDVANAVIRFLALTEECFKEEKGLQELLSHRQIEEGNRILRHIESSLGVPSIEREDTSIHRRIVARETRALDTSLVITSFHAASVDLLGWPQTLDGGQWIERPELTLLVDRIATTGHSVSLVLGKPGSGKSALLARFAQESLAKGWDVLAVKADQLPEEISSLDGLRVQYDLPGSVLDCLKAIAGERKVVLIVDQLDALSELVDLKTRRLSVLLKLINQAKMIENIHIVSSCREFERTYDKRLNSVDAEEVHLALPPWETIEKLLQERHVAATAWPEAFREILRVPQCLKLFLRHFCGTGESRIFLTYQAMLEQLWSGLFSVPEHIGAGALIYDIATEMAEREVLFVPVAKYDTQRRELDYTVSSGILKYDPSGCKISFVHQTLFDFARARAFVAREHSLSRYVLERQTGLFVRPKLWSALHYLRGSDQEAYRTELEAIWGTETLRPHIRMLLIDFVGHQEQPHDFEIRLLRPMFLNQNYGANAFAAIAGQKAWFDVITGGELPEAMCAEPKYAWATIRVLEAAWPFAKNRVLELLSRFWVPDTAKRDHVWYTLRTLQGWDRDALTVAIRIIENGNISNSSVHDLATIISASAPDLAPELVGAQLRKQVREALGIRMPRPEIPEDATSEQKMTAYLKHDVGDPLKKIIEGHGEWYELSAVSKAAPKAYLEYVWPPLREAIEEISKEDTNLKAAYRADHVLATALEVESDDDRGTEYPLMDSFVYAVRECATQDFVGFRVFVENNQTSDAMTVHRLIAIGLCEAASINPRYSLDYLLGDMRRFSLGNFHEDERETKMLLRTLVPNLSDADCRRLEDAMLGADLYRDVALQKGPKDRFHLQKYNRQFRLRLLLQFPKERLSPATRAIVESELRNFPHFKDRRRVVVSWTSVSPMSADEMVCASDKTIEKFLGAYPDDTGWGERFEKHGGSVEVSRAFADFAKKEPQRAIETIMKLDPATHQRPAAYAIRELPENEVADDQLFDLVLALDTKGFSGEEFRHGAADALLKRAKQPRGLPDPIIDLIERWLNEYKIETSTEGAEESKGDKTENNERSESVLWGYGGSYALPGGSYPFLNALFFGLLARDTVPSVRLVGILKKHVLRADSIDVWSTLAFDTLSRLRYCDRTIAQDFLTMLFATYPTLLRRKSGIVLVAHSLGWVSPGVTREWIEQLRRSGWSRASQAYGELIGLRQAIIKDDQWSHQEIARILDRAASANEEDQKTLCGVVHAAVNVWNDVADRTLLKEILYIGMNSENKDVGAAALDWFRVVDELRINNDTRPVLEALADGKALETVARRSHTLDRLGDVVDDAPDLVYRISRRIVDIFKDNIGNLATSAALESETLLSIAMTLQRQEEPHRTNGLELFELLLHYTAYRVRDVLMDIDRRPGMSVAVSQIRRRRRDRRQRSRRS